MNVDRVSVSPAIAERKLRAVRRALRRQPNNAEYLALEAAYAEAVKNRPMIQLSQAIVDAPRDLAGRPRLAIARADRRRVRVELWGSRCTFSAIDGDNGGRRLDRGWSNGSRPTDLRLAIDWPVATKRILGYGLVPIVPPDVRESVLPGDLRRYSILFEVERWAESPIDARPDKDPYLLRHVSGDLWAIMAEWDLTAIERAVMAARARD